jgi:hypothetical protein
VNEHQMDEARFLPPVFQRVNCWIAVGRGRTADGSPYFHLRNAHPDGDAGTVLDVMQIWIWSKGATHLQYQYTVNNDDGSIEVYVGPYGDPARDDHRRWAEHE